MPLELLVTVFSPLSILPLLLASMKILRLASSDSPLS
jgi:hypothetical protein